METATLVLLPGLDGTGDLFGPLRAALPPDVNVRAISYPDAPLSYDDLCTFVRAQVADLQSFVVLGESFSGPIAVTLAAQGERGVVGCILCASFLSSPNALLVAFQPLLRFIPLQQIPTPLAAPLLFGARSTPALRRAFGAALAKVSRRTLVARLNAVRSIDVTLLAKRINVPVLYLRATRDRLVSARAAKHLVDTIPGAQTHDVDGPHFLLQSVPKECAHFIAAFLRRVNGC